MSFTQGFVVASMPRASLQIVQVGRIPEAMLKAYSTGMQAEDRLSWQAMLRGRALRASDVWSRHDWETSRIYTEFLQPNGLRYAAAAPLTGPLFRGYPGAAYLVRTADQGDFSDADLAALQKACHHADKVVDESRDSRLSELPGDAPAWSQNLSVRLMVFDAAGKIVFPSDGVALDDRLLQQLRHRAIHAVEQAKKGHILADRLTFPDVWGDLWAFRGVLHRSFPALGHGPYVFYSLQPAAEEWTLVRANDVHAEPELVRMLPALRFMYQDFQHCPSLNDIARKAHLSPFHFHRRFSDVIGQTPKHYMLSCQVIAAKRMLFLREKELAVVAAECGFAHQSHFTSRFKQATGLTPTKWRRYAVQLASSELED